MTGLTYSDLLGKEFRYGGRGPDAYDCYGLMIETRRRCGLPMPDQYTSTDIPQAINDQIDAAKVGPSGFCELPGPAPFCIVTFKLHPRLTTHIGMVLEDCNRFIHILRKMRVGVERLDNPAWERRITGFWEIVNPNG